jgi:Tfp pilus assembly protein FimT
MSCGVNQIRGLADAPIRARHTRGITLFELSVALGIVGVLVLLAAPMMVRWQDDQAAKQAARGISDLLLLARSESIRTGDQHVVYFGPPGTQDPAGTDIQDGSGSFVPMLVLDDGPEATANCRIDAGEAFEVIRPVQGLSWGVSSATSRAPNDSGTAPFAPPQSSGSTFADPTGTARSWVLFRADGIPVVFSGGGGDCGAVGNTGTGGAALYITNGKRDYAVVLTPLGTVRVHAWADSGGWTN